MIAEGFSPSFIRRNVTPNMGFHRILSRTTSHVRREVSCVDCIFRTPNPQGKLVTVLRGSVLDVAVDVRRGSPSFGKHVTVELTDENRRQLWIPRGFAHGFVVTSESADFFYKCDAPYSPKDEIVVHWGDPKLGIDWGAAVPIVSQRDKDGRRLADLEAQLPQYEPA